MALTATVTVKKVGPVLAGDQISLCCLAVERMFGRCSARLLQQVHFWCTAKPNRREGKDWCYNTYDAWAEQVGYSVRQVKTVTKALRERGVLATGNFNKMSYDRTLWYRVDYDALAKAVAEENCTTIVQKLHDPSCNNCTTHSAETALTIPEMNTENTPEIDSASAKAEKTCCNPERQTGKDNEKQDKLKELNKQGTPVMSKKELVAIPAHSDLPVKKHTSLAEQVGTGEMKIATAKELMAAQSAKDANTHRLPTLWLKHRYAVTGVCQKPLTVKEMSQLKTFSKYMGESAEVVLRHTLENWWVFAAEAKAAAGLEKMPTEPEPGFLLKYCEHSMRLYLQSIAEPVKIEVKPVLSVPAPVALPATPGVTYNNLGEEVYKPSQAEIAALLAEL